MGINTKLASLLTSVGTMLSNIGELISGQGFSNSELSDFRTDTHAEFEEVKTLLAGLQDTMGAATGGPPTTLVGLLTTVAGQTKCLPQACPPDPSDPQGCPAPFTTTGMRASLEYDVRVFPTWDTDNLPLGVEVGTFLEHAVEGGEITHEESGPWKLYVKSTKAATFSMNPDENSTFPTNQWLSVGDIPNIAVNVEPGADVVAYLCSAGDLPFVDCVEVASSLSSFVRTINGTEDISMDLHAIPFTFVAGQVVTNELQYEDFGHVVHHFGHPGCVTTTDTHGYVVTWVSGDDSACSIEYVTNTGAKQTSNIGTIGSSFTIPSNTVYLEITNRIAASPADTPFVVQICPPI